MWMRPSVNGGPAPSARCAHAMAACDKSKLYSFGGWNGQKMMNDLYIFFYGDSTQMSWHRPVTTGTIPGPRAGHTMSAIGNRLLVFGGGDGSQYLNDLHILDTETMVWSQAYVAGTSPAARSRHTATVIGSRLFIFGGGDDSRVFNDVYMLDTDTMSWSRPVMKGNLPAARWGHTATLIGDGKLLIFGGHDGTKMLADVHILDIQTMTWSQPTIASKNVDGTPALVPSARAGHTSTFLNSFGKLLMFGGGDGSKILNDIWLLDLTTFLWIRPSISGNAPPGRCAHATFLIENKLIVFGGGDGNRRFKDLYILDVENVLAAADQNKTKTKKANPPKKRTIDPTKVLEERPKDITTFLTNLGMKKYLDKFISQEIDVDTLPLLTETHLEQLGVSTIGARLKILAAVKPLKSDYIEETREKDPSDNIQLLNESIDTLCSSTNRLTEALKMLTYSNHPTPPTTPKSTLQTLPQPMQHNLLPSKLELQNY